MCTRIISNFKHTLTRLSAVLLVLALLLPACAGQPQPARVEEITFQSGEFNLVGDLRTPAGTGPFPVVLFVHGSGPIDRTMFGYYLPIMERMLQAGYAVFSWDKPGTGESTPELDESDPNLRHKRAQILLEAIELMKSRPEIDPTRIGVWGISQAGFVIPIALTQTEDIAFVICVSCGGMSGHDGTLYQITSLAIFCSGVPEENADQLTVLLTELNEAQTYETYEGYLHYREVLEDLLSISLKSREASAILAQYGASGVIPEQAWLENDPEIEDWWNPVEVLEQVRIPVLAIFGDRDGNGDTIQAAYAWRKALEQAGNTNYRVELYPGVDHFMVATETRCRNEHERTFDQVLQEQGYGPLEESFALFQQEPGQHTPLSAFPYVPAYLDLIEEWLRDLEL